MTGSVSVVLTKDESDVHRGHTLTMTIASLDPVIAVGFCEQCKVEVGRPPEPNVRCQRLMPNDSHCVLPIKHEGVCHSRQPDWTEPTVPLSTLSMALDEIYRLRSQLAYEAEVLDTHLTYKTFPKSRRRFAEEQVEQMRAAARGLYVPLSHLSLRHARESAGMSQLLTRSQWEAEKGIG